MILISNCRHGSEIAVYTVAGGPRPFLRKAASTPEGIADLRNEWTGWHWYADHCADIAALPKAIRMERSSYMRIDFPFIKGAKGNYSEGILRNQTFIQAAVNHYIEVWPKRTNAPFHGDLSIDNLLFNQDRVFIVDWEHFSIQDTPWGLDALHIIFETLWFDVRASRAWAPLKKTAIPWVKELRRHSAFDPEWGKTPLAHLSTWIRQHKDRWGTQLQYFPDKLPILRFSPNQIKTIDAWFQSA